jgi:hypothetical protein
MKRYSIPRKAGGVMIMTAADNANPRDEIAKWSAEMRALVDINGIVPITETPADYEEQRQQPF